MNQIYRNDLAQSNTFTEIIWATTRADSRAVAWGDWDGDGDLDLAVANFGQSNEVYENVEGGLLLDPADGMGGARWTATRSTSLAWGDYDGDGDLDLAIGNEGTPLQLYRNAAARCAALGVTAGRCDRNTGRGLGGLGWRRRPGSRCGQL